MRSPSSLAAAALLLTAPWALAQDPNLGRNLAATCANCHGTNGNARGDFRPLAGVPAERLLAALADFRSATPPAATIMPQIAKGYTDAQLRAIAAYFAAQPAPKP